MHTITRDQLLDALERLGKGVCCYLQDRTGNTPIRPCSCKYGARDALKSSPGGEQTGCPEVRLVGYIIQSMTPEEFKTILERQKR